MKLFILASVLLGLLLADTRPVFGDSVVDQLSALERSGQIPNALIDSLRFERDVESSLALREQHRIAESEFLKMAADPDTVVLDARSSNRFEQMHIVGAKNLPFTDFTAASLSLVIPSADTRVLIYCNNNVANSPVAFAKKSEGAALNLSTFTSLYTYGYRNIYELGPVIDPATSAIIFEGALTK